MIDEFTLLRRLPAHPPKHQYYYPLYAAQIAEAVGIELPEELAVFFYFLTLPTNDTNDRHEEYTSQEHPYINSKQYARDRFPKLPAFPQNPLQSLGYARKRRKEHPEIDITPDDIMERIQKRKVRPKIAQKEEEAFDILQTIITADYELNDVAPRRRQLEFADINELKKLHYWEEGLETQNEHSHEDDDCDTLYDPNTDETFSSEDGLLRETWELLNTVEDLQASRMYDSFTAVDSDNHSSVWNDPSLIAALTAKNKESDPWSCILHMDVKARKAFLSRSDAILPQHQDQALNELREVRTLDEVISTKMAARAAPEDVLALPMENSVRNASPGDVTVDTASAVTYHQPVEAAETYLEEMQRRNEGRKERQQSLRSELQDQISATAATKAEYRSREITEDLERLRLSTSKTEDIARIELEEAEKMRSMHQREMEDMELAQEIAQLESLRLVDAQSTLKSAESPVIWKSQEELSLWAKSPAKQTPTLVRSRVVSSDEPILHDLEAEKI